MTIKLDRLVKFTIEMKHRYYPSQVIHMNKLKLEIAREFGVSRYIQDNIIQKLLEFSLLVPDGQFVFRFNPTMKSDMAEDKYAKEADKLLEDLSNAPEQP